MSRFRDAIIALDTANAEAFGWSDIRLDHQFVQFKQGVRFCPSSAARTEILERLLELNHERHGAESPEVEPRLKRKRKARQAGPSLFDESEA